MTEGRSATAQLKTARLILAMGKTKLEDQEAVGAPDSELRPTRSLITKWEARISRLEPEARREQLRNQGHGIAFGI